MKPPGPKTIKSNALGLDVKKTNVAERTHLHKFDHVFDHVFVYQSTAPQLQNMALREKLGLLSLHCDYQAMLVRNISQIVDIAPSELVEQQLAEVERSMRVVVTSPALAPTTTLDYFMGQGTGHVYVLRLQGDEHAENYYYVGFTQNLTKRLHDHFCGDGATWTKLHPPVNVMRIMQGGKNDERSETISMMKLYGWQSVRGYCWCSQVLKAPPRELS